ESKKGRTVAVPFAHLPHEQEPKWNCAEEHEAKRWALNANRPRAKAANVDQRGDTNSDQAIHAERVPLSLRVCVSLDHVVRVVISGNPPEGTGQTMPSEDGLYFIWRAFAPGLSEIRSVPLACEAPQFLQ